MSSLLDSLQQLPEAELDAFFENRLYGLVLHYVVHQLITIQFSSPHFLDMVVRLLVFLLTKDMSSPQSKDEQNELLNVLRLCTCRDATRFRNESVRSRLQTVCGPDGESHSSIRWFYCVYCLTWISAVGQLAWI